MTNEFNVRYTNKDIVDKLESLTVEITTLAQHVKDTNGKIQFHTKLIWGSFGFTFAMFLSLLRIIYG